MSTQEPGDVADSDDFYVDGETVPRRGRAKSSSLGGLFTSSIARQTTTPIEEVVAENGNTPCEIAIYQSQAVTDRNGRVPEEVVTQRLLSTFRDNNRDIRVVRGLPLVDGEEDQGVGNGCSSGANDRRSLNVMQEYIRNDAPIVAADSNLLLADTQGGGCAGINGNVAASSARNITERRPDAYGGSGPWFSHVQAAMHEVNHNMGFGHCEDGNVRVHGGWAQNNDGYWEKTPEVACNDTYNTCGEYIPPRFNDPSFFLLHFHDCTFTKMNLSNKPAIQTPYNTTVDSCDFSPKRVQECSGDFEAEIQVQLTNTSLIPVSVSWRGGIQNIGTSRSDIDIDGGQTKTDTVTVSVSNSDQDCLSPGEFSVDVEITDESALPVE